jgi:hypothetical protein
MERSNILTGKELESILGGEDGEGHWVPIVDENGNVIGWKFVLDGEEPPGSFFLLQYKNTNIY